MTIHDEFSGTITLTENSSRELLKVLKEQDEEFINNVLDGKCGFTLKSVDGRSVELTPRLDSKADYERGYLRGTKDAFEEISKTLEQSFVHLIKNGPRTERHLPDYSYEADLGRRIMEQMERSEWINGHE